MIEIILKPKIKRIWDEFKTPEINVAQTCVIGSEKWWKGRMQNQPESILELDRNMMYCVRRPKHCQSSHEPSIIRKFFNFFKIGKKHIDDRDDDDWGLKGI